MKSVDTQQIYPFVADVARFFRPYTCEKIKKSLKTLIYEDFTLYHCDVIYKRILLCIIVILCVVVINPLLGNGFVFSVD